MILTRVLRRSGGRHTLEQLGLALGLGWLSQVVSYTSTVSSGREWLVALRDSPTLGWVLTFVFFLALRLRQHLTAEETAAMAGFPRRSGAYLGVVWLAGAAPFLTPHACHLTHPILALAFTWLLWPLASRLAAAARDGLPSVRWVALGHREAILVGVGAATLIFVQSYRLHLWFGTAGKDLGLFHQSIWLLSRFEAPENTILGMHAFADHMEFIDLVLAPLQWVWESAGSLLLVQGLLAGSAIAAVYKLANEKLASRPAALALAVGFLAHLDLQHAVMFDWNPTTCGAALIPWAVYFFERDRRWPFLLTLASMALCKENLVLYGAGLAVALGIGRPARLRLALTAAAVLLAFFLLEMTLLVPIYRPQGWRHFHYGDLGTTPSELVWSVLKNPQAAFALLFVPSDKIDGLLISLSSVAFMCVLAPRYGFALAPIVLERFWSTHANRCWGFHYGAGAAAVTVVAAVAGIARLRSWTGGRREVAPLAAVTVMLSALLLATAGHHGRGPLLRVRHPYHTTSQDRQDAQAALRVIPPAASVAAQNHLLPHLSGRHEIYELARPVTAEFVAIDLIQGAWPFPHDYPRRLALDLLRGGYETIACHGAAIVLKRGAEAGVPCPILSSSP